MNGKLNAATHEKMLFIDHAIIAAQIAALRPFFRRDAVIAFGRIGAKTRQAVVNLIAGRAMKREIHVRVRRYV
jgi:hypothetical protein